MNRVTKIGWPPISLKKSINSFNNKKRLSGNFAMILESYLVKVYNFLNAFWSISTFLP